MYICIYTPIMENQMEQKVANEMEADVYIYIWLYKDYMSYSLNSLEGVI